ncbi:outer membrane lipoprotein-sorting protein [Flammeovirga kamogawensis]|uniref:Outer membrane lipoprotein-sorting protein n=1 Tax=Flammeovirga kamogawensis TaxID=373891 RepID=A0ABX8GZI8_9BACT|nr:outer membrane lipoprotein-sorting protein [Flammeovirga kamogawensis]MBB6459411.1 outer membrane lipoprotein-sorting protein [Flammeovirga kamogawensis]QWG08966.1 outer membrane lipoprotein-sorting protein [Flammeovirga kamogawensis]TRX67256.1 outer membrane lipoprotein-sorting protein [Flammeovirga kamogawensis]
MKKIPIILSVIFCFITSLTYGQNASEIIEKMQDHQRGKSSYTNMTMKVVRPDWTRTMNMKSWSLGGEDYFLVLITSPAKDKGSASLKRLKEMWSWTPSIERTIKISPSMMSQAWMGSDFTNDDLMKGSSVVNDYSHKLLGKETVNGLECYKIEMIPHEDAAVVWGKVLVWVTTDGIYNQIKVENYDEDMYLVNTLNQYDVKELGGRMIPTRQEMVPADEEGKKTVMILNDAKFNQKISPNFFTQQNMKRVR